jgi:hypothetical protein
MEERMSHHVMYDTAFCDSHTEIILGNNYGQTLEEKYISPLGIPYLRLALSEELNAGHIEILSM